MNKKEISLLCYFLELASIKFANQGCNDVEEKVWNNWSIEERKGFVKEYHNWNGDPEEYDEKYLHIPDFAIISFLRSKLLLKSSDNLCHKNKRRINK